MKLMFKRIRVNSVFFGNQNHENPAFDVYQFVDCQRHLPVFSNNVLVVFGRLMITMSSRSTNGIYGRVPSPNHTQIYISSRRRIWRFNWNRNHNQLTQFHCDFANCPRSIIAHRYEVWIEILAEYWKEVLHIWHNVLETSLCQITEQSE